MLLKLTWILCARLSVQLGAVLCQLSVQLSGTFATAVQLSHLICLLFTAAEWCAA